MTGSEIAKSGFALEESIKEIFNTNPDFRSDFCKMIDMPFSSVAEVVDRQKHDLIIKSLDGAITKNLQVKRYNGQGFNQVDRRAVSKWGDTLASSYADQLSKFTGREYYPEKKRMKPFQLSDDFKNSIHLFQEEIILSALMEHSNVDYFVFVNWNGRITVAKDDDVVGLLMSEPLTISDKKTTICLGKHITWQRKGGDSGKITATDLQTKLKVGKVVDDLLKSNKAKNLNFNLYNSSKS
jgi:hypothetical protein